MAMRRHRGVAAAESGDNLNSKEAINWHVFQTWKDWEGVYSQSRSGILRRAFQPGGRTICDEKVPEDKVRVFLDTLTTAWTEQQPFERDAEREEMDLAMESMTVRSWKGKNGRLEKWHSPEDGTIVVFGVGGLGLAIGDCHGHPFITCTDFLYINSDGSYEANVPDTCAKDVFDWLLKDFVEMCKDRFH